MTIVWKPVGRALELVAIWPDPTPRQHAKGPDGASTEAREWNEKSP